MDVVTVIAARKELFNVLSLVTCQLDQLSGAASRCCPPPQQKSYTLVSFIVPGYKPTADVGAGFCREM